MASQSMINSSFWQEIAAPDDPYSAQAVRCSGYDVYTDILGKAGYFEYLYLLMTHKRASTAQAQVLQYLAIAVANPGPRDPSVHAAMAAAIGNPPAAASLSAALACAAGSYGGAREVLLACQQWAGNGQDLQHWSRAHAKFKEEKPGRHDVWPACEHFPGFAPHATECSLPVKQTLKKLVEVLPASPLSWLEAERENLQGIVGLPLSMSGVAACTLHTLGLTAEAAEMLYLLLRLPGAAAHALEQQQQGFRQFPFFQLDLQNDPARTAQGRTE